MLLKRDAMEMLKIKRTGRESERQVPNGIMKKKKKNENMTVTYFISQKGKYYEKRYHRWGRGRPL